MSAPEIATVTDLHTDVRALSHVVTELDKIVRWYKEDLERNGPEALADTLDADLISLEIVQANLKSLRDIEKDLANVLGTAMGAKYHTVMEAGTYQRNAHNSSTKCIDEDGLWRYVIDTRIVDEETGEILPTYEVIRRVYGAESKETGKVRVTGASTTKVEALGINPDDFFERGAFTGWTVKRK